MTEHNVDPAMPVLNNLQNGEIIDRDVRLDSRFERSSAWMKPLKREASAATSSTLVGSSCNACSKRTLETYNTDSKRTLDGFNLSDDPCVWSKMKSKRNDVWEEDCDIDEHSSDESSKPAQSCFQNLKRILHCVIYELRQNVHTFRKHPYIPISTLCILALLLGIGFLIFCTQVDKRWTDNKILLTSIEALIAGTIVLAFLISMMFMMIIIQRQLHKELLFKVIPQSALRKLHRRQTVIERFDLVTIFSLDIVDFTSIAAEMRPIKAMEMLNELYALFDCIVEKYGIFKVETSGDTYMVVGGAPNKTSASEAAENVVLFALEATELVKTFKTSIGDKLSIRVGIASGPAMAGVVGKSMPRYCFFGEAVNLALKMRLSSRTMKIQCSDLTFRLLSDAPNHFFDLEERSEDGIIGVEVKGKGLMNTWWINGASRGENITAMYADVEQARTENLKPQLSSVQFETISEQTSLRMGHDEARLIAQNIQRDETINRRAQPNYYHAQYGTDTQFEALTGQAWTKLGQDEGHLVVATTDRNIMVDRMASLLEMRLIDVLQARNQPPLDDVTRRELRAYVAHIESLYNHVEYHTFEHASHVTISMNKLINVKCGSTHCTQDPSHIGSDLCENPFISFMMVYSALVHDVGHTGKSNKILEDQNEVTFRHCSAPLAERLSINIAVQALGRDEFSSLRNMIMPSIEDKIEFAKILFCAILCTDVACQDTLKVVKQRFDVAHRVHRRNSQTQQNDLPSTTDNASISDHFHQRLCPLLPHIKYVHEVISLTDEDIANNQDRFIMTEADLEQYVAIEHLMQVADVAHCMQGWENFIKWNYRLYRELMDCYKNNLMPEPSRNWSAGQICFINGYILPLAKRTEKCCGLAENFSLVRLAESNKLRWENEGQFITAIFISGVKNGEDENSVLKKCFANNHNTN